LVAREPGPVGCPHVVTGAVHPVVGCFLAGMVARRAAGSTATAGGCRRVVAAANVAPALPLSATAGGERSYHGDRPVRVPRPAREALRHRSATVGHFRHQARGPVIHRDPRSASCVVYGRSRTNLHQRHRMSPRRTVHVYVTTAPVECVLSRVRAAPRGDRDRLTGSSVLFPDVFEAGSLVHCPAGM